MTAALRPVERDHVLPIIALETAEAQRSYVSANAKSLAQAAHEPGAYPFGIWDGATLVGFCQMIDLRENTYRRDGEDPDQVYLWRFMIDRRHQGRGHGRAALRAVVAWARARGVASVSLSVVPGNLRAVGLYEKAGFRMTGRVDDGEAEMRLRL